MKIWGTYFLQQRNELTLKIDVLVITLCNKHSLRVANGQIPGDRVGNYTCFNNGEASVVDCLLTEIPLHKNILDFKDLPPEFKNI